MADSTVGGLPAVPSLDDESLFVCEQQGEARKLTGGQLKDYAKKSVAQYTDTAKKYAEDAAVSADAASNSADQSKTEADRAANAASEAQDAVKDSEKAAEDSAKSAADSASSAADAAESAADAELAVEHYPKIGDNGNWEIYQDGAYQDTGKPARGETGKGFRVLGYYPTVSDLDADVVNPDDGDAYGVGASAPYDIYIYDDNLGWVNNGTIQGPPGPQGETGNSGVYVGKTPPEDPSVIVWVNPDGTTTSCSYEEMQLYVNSAIEALTDAIIQGFEGGEST